MRNDTSNQDELRRKHIVAKSRQFGKTYDFQSVLESISEYMSRLSVSEWEEITGAHVDKHADDVYFGGDDDA